MSTEAVPKSRTWARDALLMVPAILLFVALVFVVVRGMPDATVAEREAARAKRVEFVERMRVALARAADAEKGAVLAITDEDSVAFADQARAATGEVQREREELSKLVESGGNPSEKEPLERFSRAFSEFLKMDADILALAVKNTNIKAYQLAFGSAAQAVREIDTALSRFIARPSLPRDATLAAVGVLTAVMRIQALLPPHIAEESDPKMDQLEAQMATEEQTVKKSLDALSVGAAFRADPDLATARASYARFSEVKAQILKLSRENTNVRSLSMTLDQERRRVFASCQDALDGLRQAILADGAAARPAGRAPVVR